MAPGGRCPRPTDPADRALHAGGAPRGGRLDPLRAPRDAPGVRAHPPHRCPGGRAVRVPTPSTLPRRPSTVEAELGWSRRGRGRSPGPSPRWPICGPHSVSPSSSGAFDVTFGLISSIREFAMRAMRYEVFAWADVACQAPGALDHPLAPMLTGMRAYGAWVRGEFELAVELAEETPPPRTAAVGLSQRPGRTNLGQCALPRGRPMPCPRRGAPPDRAGRGVRQPVAAGPRLLHGVGRAQLQRRSMTRPRRSSNGPARRRD